MSRAPAGMLVCGAGGPDLETCVCSRASMPAWWHGHGDPSKCSGTDWVEGRVASSMCVRNHVGGYGRALQFLVHTEGSRSTSHLTGEPGWEAHVLMDMGAVNHSKKGL